MNELDDDEESKPFKCNMCGKAFKMKGGLIQHERTHSSDRPYVCPDCGKLFRQPIHLEQHIRIHTGEKPYECSFCDKTFRHRTTLTQHLRIHTGEKPYSCMECGRTFRQKTILDQHFRTHLEDKPYSCPHPECRKQFREMATVLSHMKCHKESIDPRLVLQQAKLVKGDRGDEPMPANLHRKQHGEGSKELVQNIMEHKRMAQNKVGQDRRLSMEQEQNRQNQQNFPGHSNSESAQKSPINVPQHSSGEQSEERVAHSQSQVSPNVVATPQMAVANLFPYPHSIFPATSYMMPPPDPRQYNPQGGSHPRPSQ